MKVGSRGTGFMEGGGGLIVNIEINMAIDKVEVVVGVITSCSLSPSPSV